MAEVKFSLLPGRELSIEILEMAEVFYEDFLYYLGEAIKAGIKDEQLNRRHLRAALQGLFCYHEARLNGYVSHILKYAKHKSKLQISDQLPKLNTRQKIVLVESCYKAQCASRANEVSEVISTMKSLRNSLSHFYEGDFQLFEAVTLRIVGEAAIHILEWQSLVEASLGLLPVDVHDRLPRIGALRTVLRKGCRDVMKDTEKGQV